MTTDRYDVTIALGDEQENGLPEVLLYIDCPEPGTFNGPIYQVGPLSADEARLFALRILAAADRGERASETW